MLEDRTSEVENLPQELEVPILEEEKPIDTPLVPSPFKLALFWPGEKEKSSKKRMVREKIPAVVSSADYQLYYERKLYFDKKKLRGRKEPEWQFEKKTNRRKKRLRDNKKLSQTKVVSPRQNP